MRYLRPVIKPIFPVYRLNGETFRIGAQAGITSEFYDPNHEMWDLISSLDGSRVDSVVHTVQAQHPTLSSTDIIGGLDLLDSYSFLDEYCDVFKRKDRYTGNIAYFSSYPQITSSHAVSIQEMLHRAHILLLGLGGGGANVLALLSGLGLEKITIVDYDRVEASNLGRQLLYRESDIDKFKVQAAADAFRQMNSETKIIAINKKIRSAQDVKELIPGHDIVICALDEPQFLAQRWVNKAIVDCRIPCVFGASQVNHGRVFSVLPYKTGCFDCLHLYYTKTDSKFIDQFRGFNKIHFNPPTIAYAPAMWEVTACMVDESVRILTNYTQPRSLGVQFEIKYPEYSSFSRPQWPRYEECPTCGNGRYEDWEIFKYYGSGVSGEGKNV